MVFFDKVSMLKLLKGLDEDYPFSYIITEFEIDRDLCLLNDEYRFNLGERKLKSTASIKYFTLYNSNRKVKRVKSSSALFVYSDTFFGQKNIVSETWDAGGSTYGSCWDDENTVHEPSYEEPELPLEEFEDLLVFCKENFGYDKEETLKEFSELCEIVEEEEYYYYGGCEYTKRWEVKTDELICQFLSIETSELTYDKIIKERPDWLL